MIDSNTLKKLQDIRDTMDIGSKDYWFMSAIIASYINMPANSVLKDIERALAKR